MTIGKPQTLGTLSPSRHHAKGTTALGACTCILAIPVGIALLVGPSVQRTANIQAIWLGNGTNGMIQNGSQAMSEVMSFIGPAQVELYRAVVIKHGLLLYAKTKMKPNSAWTPSAMLKAAASITGTPYKRGQYVQAAQDLDKWLEQHHGS
jgi:hypothetical protein